MDFPVLSAVTFTPLAGAILILLINIIGGFMLGAHESTFRVELVMDEDARIRDILSDAITELQFARPQNAIHVPRELLDIPGAPELAERIDESRRLLRAFRSGPFCHGYAVNGLRVRKRSTAPSFGVATAT